MRDVERVAVIALALERAGDPLAYRHARQIVRRLERGRVPRLALIDPFRVDPEIGETTSNEGTGW